ncbi:hypothetical protein DSM104443_02370 [Usitatibacter rugosus]|uniref:IPTL-CTERM protein sorting domain-containing protein n=1 Tax=Usitatibacter rugosus TaxID=2732067 RepID=A0A6M4GVT2_9PROT|nr:IPTL-CTERM sorting domain-containing protein [Usitatibacter rugosus]QJR11296.1 hypothetical protein DSM104443_02370 [Usitatibacter rugosus]
MKAVARAVAVLVVSLASLASLTANAATVVSTWPLGQTPTLVTNINGPANAQQTSFTGYVAGPYNYVLLPLTVTQTGTYTATSSTTNVLNTTWILNGIFSPSPVAPATPLANFIVAVLALNTNPKVGTFTGFNLVAGQQYSVLVAFNSGSTPVDVSTFTINGPGGSCITLGSSTNCSRVPTLDSWALLLLALLAMGAGMLHMRRRR